MKNVKLFQTSGYRGIQSMLLLWGFIVLASCRPLPEKSGDFQLLPSPQQFEIRGVSRLGSDDVKSYYLPDGVDLPVRGERLQGLQPAGSPDQAQVVGRIDASLDVKAEGYALEIGDQQVKITGKDPAGLLYGFMTLEQLMEDAADQGVNLPQCTIRDFPELAYRAIHLDIKHHREKTDYYYRLMDRLAGYKVNAVIAEVEDKIGYELQPEVASADAMPVDEWIKLSDYAMARNIEISPLVQGLGHASFILKHDKYKDLRDDPASDWAFNPLDPRTYDVQFDLYRDAIRATPHGKYLHIGGDEVQTTGRGSGKSALELQLIWLNKVCRFAEEQGRTPIFWDDMPLKFAGVYRPMFDPDISREAVDSIWAANEKNLLEFIDQFPKNCIYMRWNYSDPGTYGNLKAMDWFTANGFRVMGATAGQTRWVLMPQNESNMENIRSFALSSIDKGLNGLLLTLWDDDSPHFELYMRGIMAFAEYAWAGDKRPIDALKPVYRRRAFGPALAEAQYAFIDSLEIPVAYWKNALLADGGNRNNLAKMEVPGTAVIDLPDPAKKGEWSARNAERLNRAKALLGTCDSIAVRIQASRGKTVRNAYTLEVYEQVNEMVRFSLETLVALENYDLQTEAAPKGEALKKIAGLPEKFAGVRSRLEAVYGQTRLLNKPEGYLLDQDHHRHLANQSRSFDWQFLPEMLLMEKIAAETGEKGGLSPGN